MSAFSTEGTMEMGRCTTTFAACAYGFTGKERDTESGNDYFLARYYNSTTGRFLSPDWSASVDPVPCANLGDPQTLNLYSYAYNNPLLLVDLYGHAGCSLEGMTQTSATCSFLEGMKDRVGTVVGKSEAMIKSGWGNTFGAFGSFISAPRNKVHFRVVSCITSDPGVDPCGSATSTAAPNNDPPLGMDIFQNSPQCPNCASIWGNASGAVNAGLVATGAILATPFVAPVAAAAATAAASAATAAAAATTPYVAAGITTTYAVGGAVYYNPTTWQTINDFSQGAMPRPPPPPATYAAGAGAVASYYWDEIWSGK